MIITKSFGASLKSKDDETGTIEAIVATYDKDSVGDKIKPGAFAKTLDAWKASGKNIPFIWSHQHDNPDAYLGDITDAKETAEGLWVKAQIDMTHPPAKRVYDLMKTGKVSQFSFAYEVSDGELITEKDEKSGDKTDEYYELREMKLFEAGPCLIGANQNTQLLGAKRAEFTKNRNLVDWPSDDEIDAMLDTMRRVKYCISHSEKITAEDSKDKLEEPAAKSDDQSVSPDSVRMMIDLADMPDEI